MCRIAPSFSGTRLDATGALANRLLGDEPEEQRETSRRVSTAQRASAELVVEPHGVLEAQCTRFGAVIGGGLSHQQTDRVAGQQMHPQLLFDHGRRRVVLMRRRSSSMCQRRWYSLPN